MRNKCLILVGLMLSANAFAFDTFSKESGYLTGYMGCFNSKVIPASGSWGALYKCIGGGEETVKLFVNEKAGTGKVKNIKFLWNEYSQNVGYIPAHADKSTAYMWVDKIAKRYAPEQADEIVSAFKSTTSKVISANGYKFKYSFHRGPAANERMIIITKK